MNQQNQSSKENRITEEKVSREASPVWLAQATAIVALLTLVATTSLHFLDRHDSTHEKLVQHRREALFSALHVIDDVYSNEPLEKGQPSNPHAWSLQTARDAENEIRIYCKDPKTVQSFREALGLYNPSESKAPGLKPKELDTFRRQIAVELELPEPIGFDPNLVWISHLAGGK